MNKPVTVAIIGAGGIGFDVAELLSHSGQPALDLNAWCDEWGVDLDVAEPGGLKPPDRPWPPAAPGPDGCHRPAAADTASAPRATRRDHDKRQALIALLEELWPAAEQPSRAEEQANGEETASAAPSRLVVDTLGLPGRAVELGGAVVARWPDLDTIEDGLGVDTLCGWSGEATRVLPFVLAVAACNTEQHALVLTLHAEQSTQVWALKSCAAMAEASAAQPVEAQS